MTTTTLSKLLASPPPGSPGAWDRLLADLDATDRDALEAAMRDRHMPTRHVLRALRAAGHRIGETTIYEVRRAYLGGVR
jgi:hypothetical protein